MARLFMALCFCLLTLGCQPPATVVPTDDPILTGLEVGLEVASEILLEEGYTLRPSLTEKPRLETHWRDEPHRKRSVTVTLRDTPQGLLVATRILSALPAAGPNPIPEPDRIEFDGQLWHLQRPLPDDDRAEQLRIARLIHDRWMDRMRAQPR